MNLNSINLVSGILCLLSFFSSFYHVYEHVLVSSRIVCDVISYYCKCLRHLEGNKAINITMLILNIVFLVIFSSPFIISLIF